MTIYATQRQRKSLREERRMNGLCLTCGDPVGVNSDGTPSRYCDPCREKVRDANKYGRRGFQPHGNGGNNGRPRIEHDDPDVTESFLDSPWFKAECVRVVSVIPFDGHITIGGIRAKLGDAFPEQSIHDIIESLVGDGSIRRLWGALPSRYQRIEVRKEPKQLRTWTTPV